MIHLSNSKMVNFIERNSYIIMFSKPRKLVESYEKVIVQNKINGKCKRNILGLGYITLVRATFKESDITSYLYESGFDSVEEWLTHIKSYARNNHVKPDELNLYKVKLFKGAIG